MPGECVERRSREVGQEFRRFDDFAAEGPCSRYAVVVVAAAACLPGVVGCHERVPTIALLLVDLCQDVGASLLYAHYLRVVVEASAKPDDEVIAPRAEYAVEPVGHGLMPLAELHYGGGQHVVAKTLAVEVDFVVAQRADVEEGGCLRVLAGEGLAEERLRLAVGSLHADVLALPERLVEDADGEPGATGPVAALSLFVPHSHLPIDHAAAL